MGQNRPPPAFQEYAAAIMAKVEYRILNLAERGLLYSMRLECWVNHGLPTNPVTLAKILGFPSADVSAALPSVMPFFAERDGLIVCPELEDYRAHVTAIRSKQSAGGKDGAAKTNGKRKPSKTPAAEGIQGDSGNPRGTRRLSRESLGEYLVQFSPVQSSQNQSLENGTFIAEYERASNGH